MKTGRNNKCPCGSGKKYKRCCLHEQEKLCSQSQESSWQAAVNEYSQKEKEMIPKPIDSAKVIATDPIAIPAKKSQTWHNEPATPGQLKVLKRHNLVIPSGITRGQAGLLIAEHDKPTEEQVSALKNLGWTGNPIHLTQGKAGKLITQLSNAPSPKQREFLSNRGMKVPKSRQEASEVISERLSQPTEKQLRFLRSLGHKGKVSSIKEASELIQKLLANRTPDTESRDGARQIAKEAFKRAMSREEPT